MFQPTADPTILARARAIRLLVLDVDGVLSDGQLYFSNGGEELKAFNTQDGLGLRLLQDNGIAVGIITGRESQIVARRAQALGIEAVVQGCSHKLPALEAMARDQGLDWEQIAYMGDDLPDLPAINRVGLGMTPANGHWLVQRQAHWHSRGRGGQGAVREACDLLLQAQDKLHLIASA